MIEIYLMNYSSNLCFVMFCCGLVLPLSFSALPEIHSAEQLLVADHYIYRKISNIRLTYSPNLIVPRLVLQLALANPIKPGVRSRMKM